MKYLTELHAHSSETSGCSAVSGARLADLYKSKGYHAITVMDHYWPAFFERLGDISWHEKIDRFLSGYRNAKERGEQIGLTVILGMEIRFSENANDYLVFGLDEGLLYEKQRLYNYRAGDFAEFARDNGLLFIQAHPFRNWMTVVNHDFLDGFEIYNAHPGHNSRNYLAEIAYSEQRKRHESQGRAFIATVGSDCHQVEHAGAAGIISDALPGDARELAELLRGQEYEIWRRDMI